MPCPSCKLSHAELSGDETEAEVGVPRAPLLHGIDLTR